MKLKVVKVPLLIRMQKKPILKKCIRDLNTHFTEEDTWTGGKHMKMLSISVIREMQLKSTMKHHFTPQQSGYKRRIQEEGEVEGEGEETTQTVHQQKSE